MPPSDKPILGKKVAPPPPPRRDPPPPPPPPPPTPPLPPAALLHVAVYAYAAHGASGSGALPMPQTPALAEWQVPINFDSTQSEEFPEQATFIMVRPDAPCCLAFGADPVAKVGVHPVEAGERMWYGVHKGQRLAVIDNS